MLLIAKKQKTSVRNKKRFRIIWAVKMGCVVEIRAKSKKEALELFCKDDDQIWNSLECCQSEIVPKPCVREVKV